MGQRYSQPEKDSEARDVEVSLGSEELHVHVIIHVRLQLSLRIDSFARVFPHLTHCI